MKNIKNRHLSSGRRFDLTGDKIITFNIRKIQIECRQGVVWITWPDGNEYVLKKGQAMVVASKGLICVQAFSFSTIFVKKTDQKHFFRTVFPL
jgi:hypothetical protein